MLRKLINLIRIDVWLRFLGIPVLGYFFVSPNYNYFDLALIFSITFFLLAFSFSYDVCYDILQYKRSKKYPDFKTSLRLSMLFLVTSLLFSAFVSTPVFVLISVESLIVFMYYQKPFRLKSIPFIVTLTNASYFAILFLMGALFKEFQHYLIYPSILIFLGTIISQLIHEIKDHEDDLKNRIYTTAIRLGTERTKILIYLSLFAMAIWSFIMAQNLNSSLIIFWGTFSYAILGSLFVRLYKNPTFRIKILSTIYASFLLIIFYFKL